MSIIDQIKAPIKEEMDSFESKFKQSMATKVPLLNKVTNYIVKRKGKQMRPEHEDINLITLLMGASCTTHVITTIYHLVV